MQGEENMTTDIDIMVKVDGYKLGTQTDTRLHPDQIRAMFANLAEQVIRKCALETKQILQSFFSARIGRVHLVNPDRTLTEIEWFQMAAELEPLLGYRPEVTRDGLRLRDGEITVELGEQITFLFKQK